MSARSFFNIAILGAIFLSAALAVSAQDLTRTNFEDGTGSIGLPPGWRIDNAYRGSVTCVGPNGAAVILKMPWVIVNPLSSVATLPTASQYPVVRRGDIIGALREVLKKYTSSRLLSVRGAVAPGHSAGVPAYYLMYEFEQNGVRKTGLGYFTPLDYGASSPVWELYSSAVIAPSDQFDEMVQPMLRMWRSWRPNGQEPREGSDSALFDKIMEENRLSNEFWRRQMREVL